MSIRKRKYSNREIYDNLIATFVDDIWPVHLNYCLQLPSSLLRIVLEYWQPCMCDVTYWPKEEEWFESQRTRYDLHFDNCVYFQDPGDVCVWCHRAKGTLAKLCSRAFCSRITQHYAAS